MTSTKVCSVTNCEDPILNKRGWCGKHYQHWKKDQPPMHAPYVPRKSTAEERVRFYGWTVTRSGCWEWNGHRDGRGYGRLRVEGRLQPTHRVAYEIWVGPIPELLGTDFRGTVIMHKCDNPPCINPEHLEPGTQAQNMRDMRTRGRGRYPSGESAFSSRLTQAQVHEIRDRYPQQTRAQLARDFGVGWSTVQSIINNRTWREAQ